VKRPQPEKVLVAPERLVYPASRAFRRAGLELIASLGPQSHRVIVDLGPTVEADSTGLEALIAMQRRAWSLKHALVLANVGPRVAELLEITKLKGWFAVESPRR
jgi:anti-anti-sigma regulatory factor